jgi:uncharacterized protein YggU (UPF0235/DUF167 family)
VIALLADKLGIGPDQITILSGQTSAAKVLEIEGTDEPTLRVCLERR